MDPKDNDQFEHLVAISSYFLGSGCRNGTSTTQLVVVSFTRSTGNAHWTTHHRSDNTTPTTYTRGHDESRAAEQCPPGTGPNHFDATRCYNCLGLALHHFPEGLTTVEAPLRASKNFQEALATLRSWRQQVITVVNDLGGNPEPLKLLSSLRTLISSMVSSDNAFATEVEQIFRTTQVKNNCTDQTLLADHGNVGD